MPNKVNDHPMSDKMREALFGPLHDAPTEPDTRERLDMSRCKTYAVKSQWEAEGLFRSEFGVEPSVSVYRAKYGWTIGMTPEGDSDD